MLTIFIMNLQYDSFKNSQKALYFEHWSQEITLQSIDNYKLCVKFKTNPCTKGTIVLIWA